ncbi:prolyl oligopeptidase family serine peptidase [Bacillus sp. CGMCC 1.16607]|uniref:prolyl oligopeptidase family serine peptidase n=1 Tax=Bacillus sp. CGMCC 1.16607 TaxID=3351842 RepID=UPI00362F293D
MILVENIKVDGIPALHIVDERLKTNQLPFVIFIHGFTSAKEHNLHYAYLMAEKGMRVVLPESKHHGERQTNIKGSELPFHFWDIVLSAIDELEMIKQYFEEKELIDEDRIGVAGTSMGGIITLGALTQYEWIRSGVCLMGLPYYEKFARYQMDEMKNQGVKLPLSQEEITQLLNRLEKYDLSLQPEKLKKRPLLFWHGKKDQVVPYKYSYPFYEQLKGRGELVQFLTDEKAGHQVSREGLLKTVDWFETHLVFEKIAPKR